MAETNPVFELYNRRLKAEELAKGLAQGLAQGRAEGVATMLLRQLAQRFGPLPQPIADRVRRAGPEELDSWIGRVLTAKSLPEVFD